MFECELNAGQTMAILVLPRILKWIRDYLGGCGIVDPERDFRPKLVRIKDNREVYGLEGGHQKVIEFEAKVYGLELRIYVAVERSTKQTNWEPVSASWNDASCPDRYACTDIHFSETHLVCLYCGDKGEAWRFEMNRTCSCGQTLKIANAAYII